MRCVGSQRIRNEEQRKDGNDGKYQVSQILTDVKHLMERPSQQGVTVGETVTDKLLSSCPTSLTQISTVVLICESYLEPFSQQR